MEYIHNCPVCNNQDFDDYLQSKDYFLTQESFTINRCKECDLLFTNPRPTEFESKKYYETKDYISHSSIGSDIISKIYRFIRRITIQQKISILNKYISGKSILDIGSGTGEFLYYLKTRDYEVMGVEPNEIARNSSQLNYGLTVNKNFSSQDFKPKSINAVTMWHVLEHIYPLKETISGIKSILSIDGILIVALPNPESKDAKIYQMNWAGFDLPRHIYHFSPKVVAHLFNNFGFELVKIKPMYFDSFYISMLSEKYKRGSINYLNALINGFRSNFSAKIHGLNYSSLIYVFRLKKA